MIQTSYVPLEHPYQIIEYNGTIGIQIGTLIVTREVMDGEKDDYAIETHSHPVVSYVNKGVKQGRKDSKSLSLPRPYEGVVWDKVELHELRTLTREDEQMSWADFMDYCRRLRLGELEGTLENVDAIIMDNYGVLLDWNITIGLPKCAQGRSKQMMVELDNTSKYGGHEYLMTEGDMGIVVQYCDRSLMIGQIITQADFFLSLMDYFDIADCEIKFWTQNLFLQDLTDEVNEQWKLHRLKYLPYRQDDEESNISWMVAEDIAEPTPDE